MSKEITTIVVDDEPLGRDGLILRLKMFSNIKVLATCANAKEADVAIKTHQPELVFLDIEMPEESGIEFLTRLPREQRPFVIFVTAYKNHALEAFDLDVTDYLLKPVNADRLEQAISKVENQLILRDKEAGSSGQGDEKQYQQRLKIKDGDTSYLVACDDILWIEAAGDYMCVNTEDKTHILRQTMKELVQILDPAIFQRVHRSTILNITKIVSTSTYTNGELFVSIGDEKSFKVSRSYASTLKKML